MNKSVCCSIRVVIIALCMVSAIAISVHAIEPTELANRIDRERYPNVYHFIQSTDFRFFTRGPAPEANRWWCPAEEFVQPSQEVIEAFLTAAAADHMTALRWLSILAIILHAHDLPMCNSGDVLNAAIAHLNLDLGLDLPLRELGVLSWTPQHDPNEPGKLMHVKMIYRKPYIHRFPKEVLPVDLLMGRGEPVRFLDGDAEREGYLTTMDFYVTEDRIGFGNMKGWKARRQGILGWVQRILFFLPDDLHNLFLYPKDNALVTSALITMTLPNFETTLKYQMRIRK